MAQLLRDQHRPEEAQVLEKKARDTRDTLLPQYAQRFKKERCDELGSFDYMVSYKAGRTTMGHAPVKPLDIVDTGIDQSIAAFGRYDSQLHDPSTGNEL